jgi:hypothetical protein
MALSSADVDAIIDEVRRDPALRDRLREAILADDFLALPGLVRQLGERVDQLGEGLERLTERMDALTLRVEELAGRMDSLTRSLDTLVGRVGNQDGELYEIKWQLNQGSRLGGRFRRIRPLVLVDWPPVTQALDSGLITDSQWRELTALDAVALVDDRRSGRKDIVATIELSRVVDIGDVTRAADRAHYLESAGIPAIPVVAGERITEGAWAAVEADGIYALISNRT